MAAKAAAVRRKAVEFAKPRDVDAVVQRPARLPLEVWQKIDAIAKQQAAEGRVSTYTKRKVSANDVLRVFVEAGLRMYEAEHGPTRLEPAAAPAKKKAATKKGGTK